MYTHWLPEARRLLNAYTLLHTKSRLTLEFKTQQDRRNQLLHHNQLHQLYIFWTLTTVYYAVGSRCNIRRAGVRTRVFVHVRLCDALRRIQRRFTVDRQVLHSCPGVRYYVVWLVPLHRLPDRLFHRQGPLFSEMDVFRPRRTRLVWVVSVSTRFISHGSVLNIGAF